MSTFDKREEGFEKKYAHDEALQFKANARRNKWLGLWAAEKMGMTGEAAETYAKSIVAADVEDDLEVEVGRPAAILALRPELREGLALHEGSPGLEALEAVTRKVAVERVELVRPSRVLEDDRRAVIAKISVVFKAVNFTV